MVINDICRTAAKSQNKHSVSGDCFVCTAATLTYTFWLFEEYMPQALMNVLRTVAMVLMFFIWIYMSFINGCRRKISFAVFTGIFWILPASVAAYSDGITDPDKFTIEMYTAGEITKLFGTHALSNTKLFSEISPLLSCVIFAGVCLAIFIAASSFAAEDKNG